MSYEEMSMSENSAPALSQHSVVSVPSAVGGDSFTSRAVGTYEVYWKMSPMSLRLGRCKMTRASTLPSGPPLSSLLQPTPVPAEASAAPIAMLLKCLMPATMYKPQAKLNLSTSFGLLSGWLGAIAP